MNVNIIRAAAIVLIVIALLFKFAWPVLVGIAIVIMIIAPFMTSGKGDRDYHNRD